jgi:hypothetical protein
MVDMAFMPILNLFSCEILDVFFDELLCELFDELFAKENVASNETSIIVAIILLIDTKYRKCRLLFSILCPMSNKWKIFWLVSLALVVLFQACGMHSWEEVILSKSDEKRLGREYDELIKAGSGDILDLSKGEKLFVPETPEEHELYNYYQERAQELVKVIDPGDWEHILPSGNLCGADNKPCTKSNFFEFKIIRSPTVNAFAVPGGYVFFYTSILKTFKSESELMSVLGHEVGHVVLHHSRDRIVKQVGASVLVSALGNNSVAGIFANLGASFWLLSHSQDNESESDEIAFKYTQKLGISSKGLGDFFSKGFNIDANGYCTGSGDRTIMDAVGEVLSTHPPSCERVNRNNERIRATGQDFPKDKNFSNGKSFADLVAAAGL